MNKTMPPAKSPRWPLVLAIVGPPVLIGALLASTVAPNTGTEHGNLWIGASPYGPRSKAPAAEVRVVLNSLHGIGAQCLTATPDLAKIGTDVTIITDFAKRYPVGRFPIDDETATASSLLIVTREAVKICAPDQVAVINTALTSVKLHQSGL